MPIPAPGEGGEDEEEAEVKVSVQQPKQIGVAFIAKSAQSTGNLSTFTRIKQHLTTSSSDQPTSLTVTGVPALAPQALQTLRAVAEAGDVQCVLGIHAYHAGKLMPAATTLPWFLVLGGTDVNDLDHDDWNQRRATVKHALAHSTVIICFNLALMERTIEIMQWQHTDCRILPLDAESPPLQDATAALMVGDGENKKKKKKKHWFAVIPQAVPVNQPLEAVKTTPRVLAAYGYNLTVDRVFLQVASIRRVKDPLFLVSAFQAWHAQDSSVHLVLAGPLLEAKLSAVVLERFTIKPGVQGYTGVYYLGVLSSSAMYKAVTESTALVNSSLSEGMSGALLEAMLLRTVVLARRNPGNSSVVTHDQTGFLYETPDEFVSLARRVLVMLQDQQEDSQSSQLTRIVAAAQQYVRTYHSCEAEARRYRKLIQWGLQQQQQQQ